MAGDRPKRTEVVKAKPTLKRRTGQFILMTDSEGKEFSGSQAMMSARLRQARSTPRMAPAKAMVRDSVRS